MNEIKNKRISRDTIKSILDIIYGRYCELDKLYLQYEEESKDYHDPRNDVIKNVVVNGKPKLEFSITIENQTETNEDINWVKEVLDNKSNKVENISISFISFYCKNTSNNDYYKGQRSQEDVFITLRNDYASIKFDCQNSGQEFDYMKNSIESLINNAPASYDKTISQKYLRENIPSLAVGLTAGLLLSVGLYLLCRFTNIDIYINNFVLSNYFVIVSFLVSVLLGFVVPGKNHSLYRSLKIKKKYAGYSSSKNQALYKDDINELLNNPEVEIGKFYNNGKIRKQIEKNYSASKFNVFILTVLFIAFYIVVISL